MKRYLLVALEDSQVEVHIGKIKQEGKNEELIPDVVIQTAESVKKGLCVFSEVENDNFYQIVKRTIQLLSTVEKIEEE